MMKAIIFDVDGTLSETEEIHRQAFNHAFKGEGLSWNWDRNEYRELLNVAGGKERMLHYIEQHDRSYLKKNDLDSFIRGIHKVKTAKYTQMVNEGDACLRPGIRELISTATDRRIRLAIATTTSVPNVEALLGSAFGSEGMELFEVICAGDSVKAKKPAPDIYLSALQQLGLDASDCIAIEDSRNGLLSATAAGIPTVVTPGIYTDDHCFDEASLVVSELNEDVRNQLLSTRLICDPPEYTYLPLDTRKMRSRRTPA